MTLQHTDRLERAMESLVGLTVGDGLGQCFFSLPSSEAQAVLERQSLPQAPWYYTDDSEMSLSVLANLARYQHIEQDALALSFAHHYSYDRAYGPAMHRALLRIREGEHWRTVASSLFAGQGSYGNGAAMRAAPIGAYFAGDTARVKAEATRSAELTHAHPEAIAGTIAVALAASIAWSWRGQANQGFAAFLSQIIAELPESEVRTRLLRAKAMEHVQSLDFPVSVLGAGHEMAAHDTVPFALWCCAQSLDNYEEAIRLGLQGGIDKDTICAIIGGVVVGFTGSAAIPSAWLERSEKPDFSHFGLSDSRFGA